jgi:hypothetical protein
VLGNAAIYSTQHPESMKSFLLLAVLQIQPSPAVSEDSIAGLRKLARRAESEFERLSRQLAPLRFAGSSGSQCDEIVGRFCLTYDSGRLPEPEPEKERVTVARRVAIEALRGAFTYEAGEFATAGPLVRYLVEDDRSAEAMSAARMYALVSADSVWGPLLLGFAAHAALEDTLAERLFAEAIPRLSAVERKKVTDLEWLLSYDDRKPYGRLSPVERTRFERRLWRLADPLYLTPGNERWTEHVARFIWARILERTPMVTGMLRWGEDLDQLTIRYGVPQSRTRTPGTFMNDGGMIEHYDPDQLAWMPEDVLSRGVPPAPLPGERWELERPRNRSGYAPGTLRKLSAMSHQATRFPSGDLVVLRVDGDMVLDTVAAGRDSVETGFFALRDTTLAIAQPSVSHVERDSARFAFEALLEPGEYVYAVEALEPVTRQAVRARYAIELPLAGPAPRLSDPLIARPFGGGRLPGGRDDSALRPRTSLVLAAADTVGLYAEVDGLTTTSAGTTRYRVDLSLRKADRASLPSRIVSWLGDKVGLSEPETPTRLAWTAEGVGGGPGIIAVDVQLGRAGSGSHVFVVAVTDLVTGLATESRRIVRIERD